MILLIIIAYSAVSVFTYLYMVKGKELVRENGEDDKIVEEIMVSVLWPMLFLLIGLWTFFDKIFDNQKMG